MRNRTLLSACVCGSLRVFDLIGPLHVVDVHADLVVEFGR